ncbi:DUF3472 domain-containing protein [Polaribacter ponticola]|uniref:DUF3472 domain-containing protein n=1 Tax=Polaribacter ponticola TaxID=2978475 RepID=A0ABT5SB29_9FLAO|nr:DUF3472 domain-containing protein [Polaribacter sp. MSW5]MDD7915312.1 DUF3472 domain-containing protein [Polaribacter sp. MSW5]
MKNYCKINLKKLFISIKHFLITLLIINIHSSCSSVIKNKNTALENIKLTKTIPVGSNSWVVNNIEADQKIVTKDGIKNWSSLDDVIRIYIKTDKGELHLGFNLKSFEGSSQIKITVGNISKIINISNKEYNTQKVGVFKVSEGYNYIEIQGLQKTGKYIANIKELYVGGSAVEKGLGFVPSKNNYFGRRGPSVHMSYNKPQKDVKWFYNEVTVPKGEDVIGSFFMANGHAQGYFGMQVNSENERRILFSIWSAFTTDDPNQIPNDYKVTNLGNGKGVTVQDFGNEGSGKQSFKVFNWKTDTTYKFLLKGEPSSVEGSTDYTGYFYNPEEEKWELIASLRRPKTKTYLTRLHSFLENFTPSTGFIPRKAQYSNQWVYTTENTWNEMTQATFTADATALNGDRFDFAGGVHNNGFFLRNCGFNIEKVSPRTVFSRAFSGNRPKINFGALPEPIP